MDSDLISRSKAVELVKFYEGQCDGIFYATEELGRMPTVDAAEAMQQFWKKTTEEKPNSSKHLIVTDGGLISHYGYYVKPKDKWFKTWECKEEIPEPAFWMDMPEPPAESIRDECGC